MELGIFKIGSIPFLTLARLDGCDVLLFQTSLDLKVDYNDSQKKQVQQLSPVTGRSMLHV
jgi:hypothetical protein